MLVQPICLLVESASHLEDHVPVHQGTVEDRDPCRNFRNEVAIEIDFPVFSRLAFNFLHEWLIVS